MRRTGATVLGASGAAVIAVIGVAPAHGDVHGSVGLGGALLATGAEGAPRRLEAEVDLFPGGDLGRYGGLLALRAVDRAHAVITAGVAFTAAASRPRLVLVLHGEVGAEVHAAAPVIGGGLRTTLGVVGPLGLAIDAGGYLILDGLDHSRLALSFSAAGVVRW